MKIIKSSLILALLTLSFNSNAQVDFVEIPYTDALTQAANDGKFVFLDFWAGWCKPCIEMEKTTFKDTALGDYLKTEFISLKIDVDQPSGTHLRKRFGVNSYPTMLVIDPQSEVVQLRMIGYKPASILMGDLKMVLDNAQMTDTTQMEENLDEKQKDASN